MKNLILPLVLLFGVLVFGQAKPIKEVEVRKEVITERVDVSVTVDSVEELESTFTLDDIKEMFTLTTEGKDVSFELVCNGDLMSNGKKSYMSYKIEGSSDDQEAFLKRVEVIRNAAIKYYRNK
jgi:hypothetical protein